MKTMVVDNNIENIKVFDDVGVNRIFVDLEINGKIQRQGGLDTVISNHSLDDIKIIKPILKKSELLVRINPLDSKSNLEIDSAINYGADILMLPMFKTVDEVVKFINLINGRAKTCLLLETTQALCRIDEILEVEGIDEIHIGLNDLHLQMGLDFMFELMSSDIVEYLARKIKSKKIPFGIGGIAKMDEGLLNGAVILKEHARLGSENVILSRTFLGKNKEIDKKEMKLEVDKLDFVYSEALHMSENDLLENKKLLKKCVLTIVKDIQSRKAH